MTSVLRTVAENRRLPAPSNVIALLYDAGNEDGYQVVPMTFNKATGVLDFDFSGSFSASTDIQDNDTAFVQGASFAALHLVNDIGPNIVAWCETNAEADSGSVRIVEKPIVVRANQLLLDKDPNSIGSMEESDTPYDFENASGSAANTFNVTYLFKKPLVVTYTKSSIRKYRIFTTQFEGNT